MIKLNNNNLECSCRNTTILNFYNSYDVYQFFSLSNLWYLYTYIIKFKKNH